MKNSGILKKYNEYLDGVKEKVIYGYGNIDLNNKANITRINILKNTDRELFKEYIK